MEILPSSPDQIRKWLAAQPRPSSAASVGGYGIVAHVISQSAVRENSVSWQDRRALDCVSLLLLAGISVDTPSPPPGPHPLFEACYRKMPRTVCLLLEHGADPLNTRPAPHDDLYVISQAFQSFGDSKQHRSFPIVMERLLSPAVVDRINRETQSDRFFRQMVGAGSPAQIRRRLCFCICKGVQVQDQWVDVLTEAGVSMDWARQQESGHVQSIMDSQTPSPQGAFAPKPRL